MPLKLAQNLPNGGIPVLSLKEYLSQDRTLVIPPWQREYSWKITADYQVDTKKWDLASWDEKAIKFRTDFYVSYFSYLIRGVAD